jgi:hypothetical protein
MARENTGMTEQTDLERQLQRRESWNNDFRVHSRELQRITEPLERWSYICGKKVKTVAMCDALMMHCEKIGLPIEKHKLDWTDFHRSIANIGKERCDAEGCDNIALLGFSTCILCKHKIERKINEQKRKAREIEISRM